ncbi:HNH endonuclease [Staphylococcus xylosus]|uniref:HNH endonuclease n=1 Tax=Staphylococcus xylosus TaxID=1288 RepID=UPI000D1EAD27|nr:HNH endonuclease [Staphylococcus xylosus]PTI27810.1 hypothetical protein BU115_03430 [Staphylococcus xylosus]
MIDYNDSKERKRFYNTKAWRELRAYIVKRDNYECQHCKLEGKVTVDREDKHKTLEVDHIKELENYPDLKLDEDNLITLCVWCHNKKHDRYQKHTRKKKYWNDEQW